MNNLQIVSNLRDNPAEDISPNESPRGGKKTDSIPTEKKKQIQLSEVKGQSTKDFLIFYKMYASPVDSSNK